MMDREEAARAFGEFVAVIKALRTPVTGCPWDLEQNHQTLRPYLVEETYEVLDAIDGGDDRSFQEELGDLLLQIVLHAQVAADRGAFSIVEVVRGITAKMVRRHPHVFGSVRVSGAADVVRNWEQIKAEEKQQGGAAAPSDPFARVPESMPALLRAQRLGEKAANREPDRQPLAALLDELRRELAGLEEQVRKMEDHPPEVQARLDPGLGNLLFGLCQLARRLGLSAEGSLRTANKRFVEHFQQTDHEV